MKFHVFNTSSDKVSVNYSLSLGVLNTKHKPSVKKRSTGPVSDRSTGVDFKFYRSGRENPDRCHFCSDYPAYLLNNFRSKVAFHSIGYSKKSQQRKLTSYLC